MRAALVRKVRAGDAHLVQIRVAGELHQRRHLRFPAEFADGLHAGADVVDHVDASGGAIAARRLLLRGGRDEVGVGRGVDESEAEERRGAAMNDDRCCRRYDLRPEVVRDAVRKSDGVILHERAAADGRNAVTRRARALIENGAKSFADLLDLGEVAEAVGEIGALRSGKSGQRLSRRRIGRLRRRLPTSPTLPLRADVRRQHHEQHPNHEPFHHRLLQLMSADQRNGRATRFQRENVCAVGAK